MKHTPWHVVGAILTVFSFISTTGFAGDEEGRGSLARPGWKDDNLGRVYFSHKGDKRRGRDLWRYRINEGGLIHGSELLALVRPVTREYFGVVMEGRGTKEELDARYRQYLGKVLEQGMGVLILNRIIDHETAKNKLDVSVSQNRVDYVMSAVLSQNAIMREKVKTRIVTYKDKDGKEVKRKVADENMDTISFAKLYSWLLETVGPNPVRFNMNWKYDGGSAQSFHERLGEGGMFEWPAVSISFADLPKDWRKFERLVRDKLQTINRGLLRQAVWTQLARQYMMDSWVVTRQDIERTYAEMKEDAFKIEPADAYVHEIMLSGKMAPEFKKRFYALVAEREKAIRLEIYGEDGSKTPQPAQLRKRVLAARSAEPAAIFGLVVKEFAKDIAAGTLKASIKERKLVHNGRDALPQGDSYETRLMRIAFNPMFAAVSLLPKVMLDAGGGRMAVVMMKDQVPGAPAYLPLEDERVARAVRLQIQERKLGGAFRELAYRLFKVNRFEVEKDACGDDASWPCIETDAAKLADVLFPERLFKGKSLGTDMSRRVITSTLKYPELFDRVFEIQTRSLTHVFEAANDHVD